MEKNRSLFKNSIYSIIKSGSTLLFPLISFAYASHILQSDGLGRFDFAKSYAAYFSILAMLGIVNYATREASKLRDDRRALSHFSHEILLLNLLSVVFSYIVFFLSIYWIPRLHEYFTLLVINGFSIILTAIGMEWLYSAVEDYRYISIRTAIIQVIALLATVLFVKTKKDLVVYAVIQVGASVGTNVINLVHSRKYIDFHYLGNYHPLHHLKPVLYLFGMTLFIQIFTQLDTTMLGFMKNDHVVGLYSAATKMSNAAQGLIIAITVVLAPRIAYYYEKQRNEEIKQIVKSAIHYIFMIGFPAMIGLFLLAPQLIVLFSGESFIDATMTSRIMAIRVFVVPLNTFFIAHYFIPVGREKNNIISTGVAAAFNVCFNSLLIPGFAQDGAAVATVCAEFIELIFNLHFISKIYNLTELFKGTGKYIVYSFSIIIIWTLCSVILKGTILIIAVVALSLLLYLLILIRSHDIYFYSILNNIKKKKR